MEKAKKLIKDDNEGEINGWRKRKKTDCPLNFHIVAFGERKKHARQGPELSFHEARHTYKHR